MKSAARCLLLPLLLVPLAGCQDASPEAQPEEQSAATPADTVAEPADVVLVEDSISAEPTADTALVRTENSEPADSEKSPEYATHFQRCSWDRYLLFRLAGSYNPEAAARIYTRTSVKNEDEREIAYQACLDALNRERKQ